MSTSPHPQLADPAADPQAFIESSIYWYPRLFLTRTEVLDHLFLCNGNGYEWNEQGQIRSVFSHIEPDLDRDLSARLEEDAVAWEAKGFKDMAEEVRGEAAELRAIRADYLHLARTYGPVRATEQVPGSVDRQARTIGSGYLSSYTLLGRAPEHVDKAWQPVVAEVRELFGFLFVEQGRLW